VPGVLKFALGLATPFRSAILLSMAPLNLELTPDTVPGLTTLSVPDRVDT